MSVLPRWQRAALVRGRAWPSDVAAKRAHAARQALGAYVRPLVPRVLVPAVAADDVQMPPGARGLRDAATAGVLRCVVTYALAELDTPAGPELIESVAVRLRWAAGAGYAVWRNGRFGEAWLFSRVGFRRVGAAEMLAVVSGQHWAPPAPPEIRACPAQGCGKPVRVKKSGELYAHRCGS